MQINKTLNNKAYNEKLLKVGDVYFDQQRATPQTICWLKSNF